MSKIIVGIDASERSLDAAAFARDVAVATGAEVWLVAAYPYAAVPARVSGAQVKGFLNDDARSALAHADEALADAVVVVHRTIADPSPARALHELASEADADLIVVGSSHRGPMRRVLLGSTAVRVVHEAPCAVAVVPRGYATAAHRVTRIGCAFDQSPEATAALNSAAAAASAFGAELQVLYAFDPTAADGAVAEAERSARWRLQEATEHVAGADAKPVLLEGLPGDVLARRTEQLDLLFAGSRGYGPGAGVLIGSITQRLIVDAACPVVVLPRSAQTSREPVFAAAQRQAS
jgi:nucleotide-binding universal stress UspA family protein